MNTVSHHGRATAYRIVRADADGPTLLSVHGSGGTDGVWAPQYGPTGPDNPMVALDLSGHGRSDNIDTAAGEETLSAYADDVCAVADAVGADVLVGNSLGGAVVQHILLERDCDVRAAVLAGSGAKLAVADPLRSWLAEDFERAVEWLHGPDRLFHDPDGRTRERSIETMREVGQSVTARDFRSCHTFDVRERVGEISVPVLALVGEYDALTPPSAHEFLAREIPGGQVSMLDEAAHLAMLDRPVAFTGAIADFLDAHVR
jgi:3-oxoadipate enol-lactonase